MRQLALQGGFPVSQETAFSVVWVFPHGFSPTGARPPLAMTALFVHRVLVPEPLEPSPSLSPMARLSTTTCLFVATDERDPPARHPPGSVGREYQLVLGGRGVRQYREC